MLILYKPRQRQEVAAREYECGWRWAAVARKDRPAHVLYECRQMCVVGARDYKPMLVLYKRRQR